MKLKPFQREDLARGALHDGFVLAHDTGLGKGLAAYVWPLLKVGCLCRDGDSSLSANHSPLRKPLCPAEPVLIVAAADLHKQIIEEGQLHFGSTPTIIDCQETFEKLAVGINSRRGLAPGYYLANYIALSRNGVKPLPGLHQISTDAMFELLGLRPADVEDFFDGRAKRFERHYDQLGVTPQDTLETVEGRHRLNSIGANEWVRNALDHALSVLKHLAPAKGVRGREVCLFDLSAEQQQTVRQWTVAAEHANWAAGIGRTKTVEVGRVTPCAPSDPGHSPPSEQPLCCSHSSRITHQFKCIFSPSLADLCQDAFAVVVFDEGTKLKGEDTIMGLGARQMNPSYRLILTATPIKNRLPDVFRLMHWATGSHPDATARFPFSDGDRETFADEFCTTERNLSAEQRSETGRRFVKHTPQVCNIHRLWKLIAPIILRRRKADCGEQIVGKNRHVIRVPMGLAQARVYKYHLDAEYLDCNNRPAIGAKLQALRIAAANPASALLVSVMGSNRQAEFRSKQSYIPKVAAALTVIGDI